MYLAGSDQVTETVAPTSEPVTLTEAKNHLRVDISDDDTLISSLITAARIHCENYTGRSFATRTYRADLSGFAYEIYLPHGPVIDVTSVKYYDTASPSVLQTWAASNYQLYYNVLHGTYGATYPSTYPRPDAVQITYRAGYLDNASPQVENIPQAVKQAMLLMVGDLYENREAQDFRVGLTQVAENPTFNALLNSYRCYR